MEDPHEIYHYDPPPGYGDTFFVYGYNGGTQLTNGQSYYNLMVDIQDGDFVNRFWNGAQTIAAGIQIYDSLIRKTSDNFLNYGSFPPTGELVLPERMYPVNNAIRFDLQTVAKTLVGVDGALSIYASQLAFFGVRRRALHYSDPEKSTYNYYEKKFELGQDNSNTGTYTLVINNYASTNGILNPAQVVQFPIRDFDFELRRMELAPYVTPSNFAVTLYDNYGNPTSNIPILCNSIFHQNPNGSSGELNFQPSPPILYKVGSLLKLDIWSLLVSPTALPATFRILLHGVRRIPCR